VGHLRNLTSLLIGVLLASGLSHAGRAEAPLVQIVGTDFQGGAADLYGAIRDGESNVNYVYAQPTGSRSSMRAAFALGRLPEQQVFLHVKARDDDGPAKCSIAIELNGRALFEGRNEFSAEDWEIRKFPIPADALKEGQNSLVIANRETSGQVGNPPWFMVARCAIAGSELVFTRDLSKDFWVTLPTTLRGFPEPLPPGQKPGFKIRGIKGWMWKPEQYLSEIPVLAKYKMNFLMNCYTSMCDVEHYAWGNPEVNRWWEDLPESKRKAYENIVRRCKQHGIQFCFSMNPNLCSKGPLEYASGEDVDQLWKHYSWMQGLGVKWFNISLDDISQGIDASGQAKVVNEIYRRLKARDPQAKMIFTPTIYWGDGTSPNDKAYLETLARELDSDVYLFWTGNSVVGNITREAADSYMDITKHRLFLWDNYPVNDATPTMHLGPVINRDSDLCEVIEGYMSNSMCQQNEANRIPMLTCADYAYNPAAYDPMRSIGQAILHLEDSTEERELLKELVEMYPGFIIFGRPSTGLNPVREQFSRLVAMPHARYIADAFIWDLENLAARMDEAFPNRYQAEKQTVRNDLAFLRKLMAQRYKE